MILQQKQPWHDLFIHRIQWQRKETVADNMGGSTTDWVNISGAEHEALIQPTSSDEWYTGEQSGVSVAANIFFPPRSGFSGDLRIINMDTEEIWELESDFIDEGGQGEVMKVKVSRGALGDG